MNQRSAVQPQKIPTPALSRMDGSILQRKCACGGMPGPDGECAECRRKRLALQARSTSPTRLAEVPSIVHEVLRSPGQPLDQATRAFMEPHFGHDFSQVRVYTDAQVANQITGSDKRTFALFSNKEKSDGSIRKGQVSTPPVSSVASAPAGRATSAPAAPACTFSIDTFKSTFSREGMPPVCTDKCGAEALFRYTRVRVGGSGCPPSLEGLFLKEEITTDHGCGRGEIEMGWAAPISANGTIKLKTVDHYALCSDPGDFPDRGCTERYMQKLLVGNREQGFMLAETHTITFRITKSGGKCSGTVTRT